MNIAFLPLSALLLIIVFSVPALSDSTQHAAQMCESAEGCFEAARVPLDPIGSVRDPVRIRIERLQVVQERYPGSIWAKRAGLLTALLWIERDPAEAVRVFTIAQRDWPLLEDYIRFWTGESLLKIGDASQAASLFESIPEAVTDTLLTPRALFRSGEAWARAGQCRKAIDPLERAASLAPQEPAASTTLMTLADCQLRENRTADGVSTLKQIWIHYPNSPEAREAGTRLETMKIEGWPPTPEDMYARGNSFSMLALHAEAVEEFKRFLVMAPHHHRADEVKLKLGIALVRLKRYDAARETFQSLVSGQSKEAGEAAVWLSRVYLRQGAGDRLLALPNSVPKFMLSAEQWTSILLMGGTWLEDQEHYDEALAQYRHAVQTGGTALQSEALWRIGWAQYRSGHYEASLVTFQKALEGKEDPQVTPQVLYWMARAYERLHDARADELYSRLCLHYAFTYYCQLARSDTKHTIVMPVSTASVSSGHAFENPNGKRALARDRRYLKALELKLLGMDQEAARELVTLVEQYARDRPTLVELSALLTEAGAYHQALRLARLHFRESLERGGESVPLALWHAAYPTAYLSTIRTYAGTTVDPFLAAAIIREESQYDTRALSRVGAIGLMQVMPVTAQAVARKYGFANVSRDDLFDQNINIQFGVRYLEQLLQQYGGNIIHAVAAYNAGPAAVSTWIEKHGGKESDEFVELIPYQETRQYVKRVLRSYREYFRLAGLTCTAGSLDKVC